MTRALAIRVDPAFSTGVFVMRVVVLLALTAVLAGGCANPAPSATAEGAAAPRSVKLAPENVAQARRGQISAGPTISGQLTPAREATVRAQVGGSIVALDVDRGMAVTSGRVVARIASRDLESTLVSAQAQVKSAETALSVARSEAQRTQTLVKGGAVASSELEKADNAVSLAEAQLAAARAREESVRQQLDDTIVKAPFAGVVNARPASLGDVVAPGTELFTVIDPSSMRLEAQVPSEVLSQVKRGATVTFTIRGVPGSFKGTVDRLDSSADPVTRQVAVFVTVPNVGGRLIAGLFAEGRIETATHEGVVVPMAAVNETGVAPFVTRVAGGKAERVPVTLGARQTDTEQVEITKGVAEGDVLIVGSAMGLADGTPVEVAR
jgi:RND family efflux transporter MFP subunit